jgi:predicted permease
MALGIGANTTVFSVVNAVLLRPLPGIADPGRLVSLSRMQDGNLFDNFGYPDYADYRDRSRSLAGLAAFCTAPLSMTTDGTNRVHGDLVTDNYFEVLGARPALGRLLTLGDGDVAVVSYSRRGMLGSRIVLDGVPFTVVGVAQPGFRGTAVDETIDVWVPISTQPVTLSRLSEGILENRAAGWIEVFGRLQRGVSVRQAEAELKTIAGQLAAAYPQTNQNRSVSAAGGFGMYPDDRAEVSGLLGLLTGSVALLLLIACANVAGLFMVRASRRSREMAVRLAVGAGRWRLIRQLLAEGMVLALAAGAVAILMAQWAMAQIAALPGSTLLNKVDIRVDGRVLAFTLGACLLTGLLFAIVPAIQSSQVNVSSALKNGSAGAGVRRGRVRSALVVSQVVLSFILIAASATLVRDLRRIITANPGFETTQVAMAGVDMSTLPHFDERGRAFYRQLLNRLPGVPGVVSASLASTVPPQDISGRVSIFYPGQEPTPDMLRGREFELGLRVDLNRIAPRYFETLGISLLRGRDFTDHDRGAVIVSKKLADRLWPGEDALGKRIAWPVPGGAARPPFEVIGVAADAKYRSLIAGAPLLMYVPVLSEYDSRSRIVVRTAADPANVLGDIENVARSIDKDVPIYHLETMAAHTADSLWQQRTAASWIGAFSLMALILAAVGLYGVIAQSVAQRTRELGIRMALGAAPRSVSRLVLREGMTLAVMGTALGVPAALASERVMRRMLEGVGSADVGILAGVGVLLVVVTLAACWIPARRAARVDPLVALRYE